MTFGIDEYEEAAENAAFFIMHFYLKRDGRKRKFFYNDVEDYFKGVESTC